MKNEFVTYELALRMKALDYDEPCFAYFLNSILQYPAWEKDYSYFNEMSDINSNFKKYVHVLAPTWQSAFRWFRKEHNLKSFIQPIPDDVDTYMFAYGTNVIEHDDLDYLTHEEAETACLEKLLEIVEQRNNE
jgi:hypothetical protein